MWHGMKRLASGSRDRDWRASHRGKRRPCSAGSCAKKPFKWVWSAWIGTGGAGLGAGHVLSPRFVNLCKEAEKGSDGSSGDGMAIRKLLLGAPLERRKEILLNFLKDKVARVLGSSPDKVDLTKPLTEVGLDSLMAVELRNWVEGELRVSLPIAELLQGPSVDRLADLLLEQLLKADAPPAPARAEPSGESPARGRGGSLGARDTANTRTAPGTARPPAMASTQCTTTSETTKSTIATRSVCSEHVTNCQTPRSTRCSRNWRIAHDHRLFDVHNTMKSLEETSPRCESLRTAIRLAGLRPQESRHRAPLEVVLSDGPRQVNAADLVARAHLVAHFLLGQGFGPDSLVGLHVARSIDQVVGLLGILEAGLAWLLLDDLDPSGPSRGDPWQRHPDLVSDSGSIARRLGDWQGPVVAMDADWVEIAQTRARSVERISQGTISPTSPMPSSAASWRRSGDRKGHLGWLQQEFALDSRDAVLHQAEPCQAAACWEILWPLLCGGRLVLAPRPLE